MNSALEIVTRLASALDQEDYATVAEILAAGCIYVTPKGIVRGREDIVASYRAAGASAKAALGTPHDGRMGRPVNAGV